MGAHPPHPRPPLRAAPATAPQPPIVERTVELAGFRTRLLETNADTPRGAGGLPLLLLHGYSDSADTWRPMLELLERRGHRAAAIDLPGFGAADRLLPDETMYAQYLRVVAAARELLWGDEPPIVIGNSMGGALALLVAEQRPSPAAVVPIDPAGFDHPGWFQLINQQPLVRYVINDRAPIPRVLLRTLIAQAYRQLAYGNPSLATREVLARYTQHYASPRDARRLLNTGRRLLPELIEPFHHDQVDCPVLLIWGDKDRMVGPRGSRHLLEALPATRYELLRGIGHCPQLEAPELTTDLVTGFANAVRDGRASDPRSHQENRSLAA